VIKLVTTVLRLDQVNAARPADKVIDIALPALFNVVQDSESGRGKCVQLVAHSGLGARAADPVEGCRAFSIRDAIDNDHAREQDNRKTDLVHPQ
jgi:hypothetical protein